MKKVVIAGGGFAGVKLAVDLMNDDRFDVVLISPHGRFEYHGALYRSATGRSPLEVVVPYSEIFADASNVETVLDSVAELRPKDKIVEGSTGREYSYDILVMAVGYVVNYFGIDGMETHSDDMYSITSAIKLRHDLVGAIRSAEPGVPLNISVIGAGPTGVEVASDIQNFGKIVEGKHGLEHVPINVHLVEAGNRVLPGLSNEASHIALERLKEINVNVHLHAKVTSCCIDRVETDKGDVQSAITIWTAGNKANPIFASYPDLFTPGNRGRIAVDEFLRANQDDIFVIGDAADTEFSGMAQTAIHNAIALAANLKRLADDREMMPYAPKRPEYVVPIGGEWALLQTNEGIRTGEEGWKARREADKWVLENFLPYALANKHYKQGDRIADFS